MDVCLFKMGFSPDREVVIPPIGLNELVIGQVGISFVLRKKFMIKLEIVKRVYAIIITDLLN